MVSKADKSHLVAFCNIEVSGDGAYEYSLDGTHFKSSSELTILMQDNTIYVNDTKGCGLNTEEIFLLVYSKFFTPDGDGINDTWIIQFSQFEPNMHLTLFARYGKFIKRYLGTDPGWDGSLNGQQLPASDYWFVVTRERGKEYRGHFR
jgi:gliding motility-associated-like protein